MTITNALQRLDALRNHVFINLERDELVGLRAQVDAIGSAVAGMKTSKKVMQALSEASALHAKISSYI